MPVENYKKWVIIVIAVSVAAIFIIGSFTTSPYKTDKSDKKGSRRTGPLMDSGRPTVVPLEELGVDTTNPQSLALAGDKYFESGRFNQAIEIYKKVLELDPGNVDTYNDLGLAYHYTGRSSLAVDMLKKGTEVNPSYQRIWLSLGYVLLSTGRYEEAEPALQRAIELNPDTDVGREAKRMLESF